VLSIQMVLHLGFKLKGDDVSNKYTVWVGGVPDVENVSMNEAHDIYLEWVKMGYDDVCIELDDNSKESI